MYACRVIRRKLWALRFRTDTTDGEPTLLFSVGVNSETDGLVGSITPVR